MFKRIRTRITSAHVLAAMALFVALGGSAYALSAGSVGSKQLKNNAVKTKKLKNGAVKTSKLGTDAATGEKVAEATLGKVPTAGTADKAADADALEGRSLARIRPATAGVSIDPPNIALPTGSFVTAMSTNIEVPQGGGNLVGAATAFLNNTDGAPHGARCQLNTEAGPAISQSIGVTVPANSVVAVPVNGRASFAAAPADPEQISVSCRGGGADGDVVFLAGDLTVTAVPTG